MKFFRFRLSALLSAAFMCFCFGLTAVQAVAQVQGSSSSSSSASTSGPSTYAQERTPTLDPAGPSISLISSEQVFAVAAALNACGYDEGLADSPDVRKRVRDEIDEALAKSEQARSTSPWLSTSRLRLSLKPRPT
jgi:hypothetical protein